MMVARAAHPSCRAGKSSRAEGERLARMIANLKPASHTRPIILCPAQRPQKRFAVPLAAVGLKEING